MKKISSDLYIVEPAEAVRIIVEASNTPNLVTLSLDGDTVQLQGPFEFHASPETGTTHVLVFLFTFAGAAQGHGFYQVHMTGSEGGTSKFGVELSSDNPISTIVRTLRVGSVKKQSLGSDPPTAWPHG